MPSALSSTQSSSSSSSASESNRLAALRRYDILDAPPKEALDRITRLATGLFNTPMAQISIGVEDRQWFQSAIGLNRREIEFDASFWEHVLRTNDVTVIEDATTDERIADNPSVTGAPGIRFYAGAPLITTGGHRIGTLCVLDTEPRSPSDDQLDQLKDLAATVMDELELRREVAEQTHIENKFRDLREEYETTEKSLRQSEELHRATLNNITDAVFLTRDDGTFTYVCPNVSNIFSYSQEEVEELGSISALLGTDPRAGRELEPDGELSNVEQTVQTASGEQRHLLVNVQRVTIQEGTVLYSCRDITERKRAEEMLRRERDLLNRIFETRIAAIAVVDREGNIVRVNDEAERVLNLPESEITNRTHDDPAWHITTAGGDPMPGEKLPFSRVRSTGEPVQDVEYGIEWPDGTRRIVSVDGAPLRNDAGEFSGAVFLLDDVTEQRKRQRHRETLISNLPGMVYRCRNERGWPLELVEGECEELWGYAATALEAGDVQWEELIHPDDREKVWTSVQDALNNGETFEISYRIRAADGSKRWVWERGRGVNRDGELRLEGFITDVTERKQTQKQLWQAQKMETVGALAGGVAHDFNNILHSVLAYVKMVHKDLPEDNPSRILLNRASQGLNRAGALVEKLLTFSRQAPVGQTERVDVGEIAHESIELVEPSLSTSIDIRTKICDGCTTEGSPGELYQVAANIMTNAGQAMAKHEPADEPVLDVDVRRIDVDEDLARRHLNLEPGCYVRLSISDTGPGMDADTKERIFEPFFTTKKPSEGTGLGLSVVHGIVQSHDGAITVYSKPGEGTTFNVYFPYVTKTAITEDDFSSYDPLGADLGASAENRRILFVDDDEHIRELERVRLQQLGYDVATCGTAEEALQAFDNASEIFGLVLTDFAMPNMDGLDLTRKLRERGYEGPIVVMTGFSAQISPDEVQKAGATMFLRKPVGGEELNQKLSRLFG